MFGRAIFEAIEVKGRSRLNFEAATSKDTKEIRCYQKSFYIESWYEMKPKIYIEVLVMRKPLPFRGGMTGCCLLT